MNNTFQERITILINENGMTQREFAEAIGVSKSSVQSYVSGTYAGGKALAKIARYFRVSVDWLLGLSNIRDGGVRKWVKEGK